MAKKMVFVCVKRDLTHPVNFALREFEGMLSVRYIDTVKQLGAALAEVTEGCTIILDSVIGEESTLDFAKTIKKEKPALKILLIVSSGTAKEDIVALIQSKVVNGVLMRPFTAEQISDNIYKLCGFQKKEVPWYMQTGFK
jgi:DNA-binding NtrC family response regulator